MKSADIHRGALTPVGLRRVMGTLVIAFPVMVTGPLDAPSKIDTSEVRIELQAQPDDEDQPITIIPAAPR